MRISHTLNFGVAVVAVVVVVVVVVVVFNSQGSNEV